MDYVSQIQFSMYTKEEVKIISADPLLEIQISVYRLEVQIPIYMEKERKGISLGDY